jgi:UDP-N-acetylglucosamine 2-epimerase (non-hydrolysing)
MAHLPVVHLIAAARPNFMKVGPLYHELLRGRWCRPVFVHTGQHYDVRMSRTFLEELGLPEPDVQLGVGRGTHAEQTAGVMIAYERVCLDAPPEWVVVVGDVNSTLACALVTKKLKLPLAHLEAGLRSNDRAMPEEINRIVVDAIADLLWTPSADADEHLLREGVDPGRIERIGNVMIDCYERLRTRIAATRVAESLGLRPGCFGVVTLHRPDNVDQAATLARLVEALLDVASRLPLVFPVHPRTRERLEQSGLWTRLAATGTLRLTEPLGYVAFMSLVSDSRLVITDSGGVQEETTYLRIPCLTMRTTTERPITITYGTNRLVRPELLSVEVERISAARSATGALGWACGGAGGRDAATAAIRLIFRGLLASRGSATIRDHRPIGDERFDAPRRTLHDRRLGTPAVARGRRSGVGLPPVHASI